MVAEPNTLNTGAVEQTHWPVLCIMGPTAAGKTELAMLVADTLAADGIAVDLISVDAVQVYRGLDIGSAKPGAQTLQRYPHALIDIRSPLQSYDAWQFCQDTHKLLQQARQHGRIPVLVGGTMFYFNALLHGLDALPTGDAALRNSLQRRAAEQGWPALHAELAAHDSEAAAGIHHHDAQRIMRALEICTQSVNPSGMQPASAAVHGLSRQWRVVKVIVHDLQRHTLHQRIHARTRHMLESGLLDEVRSLIRQYDLHTLPPSMRAVGYRHAWAVLHEQFAESELVDIISAATRQLAKRQFTWLRNQAGAIWINRDWQQSQTLVVMRVKSEISCPI